MYPFSCCRLASGLWLLGLALVQSLGAEPPKVVETLPKHDAQDVSSTLRELRVVFDQPMSREGWSVVGGGPKFPKLVGKGRWENDRTFVWSWQLEPAHDYWLSINSTKFTNFRGQDGQVAVPYPIAFRTAPAPTPAAGSTDVAQREAVAHLRRTIDDDYSYRDLRKVDWPARFREFAPQLETAASPKAFAAAAVALLEPAQDVHLWLAVGEQKIPTYRRMAKWNIDLQALPSQMQHWQQHTPTVATAEFPDGIRYVCLRDWPTDLARLEPAFGAVRVASHDKEAIIIDVRANGGGSETGAQLLAGCFVTQPITYAKHLIRRNGTWQGPFERLLKPNADQPNFSGRVAVLMGTGTVSSSEAFVMMMKQVPGSRLIGENTAGSSGNPQPVDLGNGVIVHVPSWKSLRLDGSCTEGEGFAPDQEVHPAVGAKAGRDPVLEAALQWLRK